MSSRKRKGSSVELLVSSHIGRAVLCAIELMYRHFDTAAHYHTECPIDEAATQAMRTIASGDELFITSKLWCIDMVIPTLRHTLRTMELVHRATTTLEAVEEAEAVHVEIEVDVPCSVGSDSHEVEGIVYALNNDVYVQVLCCRGASCAAIPGAVQFTMHPAGEHEGGSTTASCNVSCPVLL